MNLFSTVPRKLMCGVIAGEIRLHEKERQKKNNHNMSEWAGLVIT